MKRMMGMRRSLFAAVGALLLLGAPGCGKKAGDGDGDDDGKSGDGDGDGDGEGDGDGDGDDPVVLDVPPAWVRPADCGGVGDLCPNLSGCEQPTSACQTLGDVCIPWNDPGSDSSDPEEKPYCAAYTCMTFDQASCFCTGDAASTTEACASPAAMAGICALEARSCEETSDCCPGLECLPSRAGYGAKSCQDVCESGEECSTGCCTDAFDNGVSVCAAAKECETACLVTGQIDCDDGDFNTPSPCCRGTCVLTEIESFAGCRPKCQKNEDCLETGCCQFFSESTEGFCVDSSFCGCVEAWDECGAETAPCCDATHCVGGEEGFSCKPECTIDDDCPGTCCIVVTGADYKVCGTADQCGSAG